MPPAGCRPAPTRPDGVRLGAGAYVWDWPNCPQYYLPMDDVDPSCLVDEHQEQRQRFGRSRRFGLTAGGQDRVLAQSDCPVMVFETGLPTRYYFDRRDVRFQNLVASQTQTACPYKGRTSEYWSVAPGGGAVAEGHQDLAWSYLFPTAALLPIAGLVAFYDEKVDVLVDGVANVRPHTHLIR